MVLLELYFLLDVMMILAKITLTFSLNNVILLINFLSMITIVGIELSVSNIEITLLILVIYESSLLCLFLVNGILLMSSLSFNYRFFYWGLLSIINHFSIAKEVLLIIPYYYLYPILAYTLIGLTAVSVMVLLIVLASLLFHGGIYSLFINSFPYWTTTIISNDFLTLNQLNKFCRCINLGDLIAVLGSIDFVLGSVDLSIECCFLAISFR